MHSYTLTPTTTPHTKMSQPFLNLNFFSIYVFSMSLLIRLPTQFYLILVGGTNIPQSFTAVLRSCNVIIVINTSQAKVYN